MEMHVGCRPTLGAATDHGVRTRGSGFRKRERGMKDGCGGRRCDGMPRRSDRLPAERRLALSLSLSVSHPLLLFPRGLNPMKWILGADRILEYLGFYASCDPAAWLANFVGMPDFNGC